MFVELSKYNAWREASCLYICERQGNKTPVEKCLPLIHRLHGLCTRHPTSVFSFNTHSPSAKFHIEGYRSWENVANLADVRSSKKPIWILNSNFPDSKLGPFQYI